jgi:hypothetical protein
MLRKIGNYVAILPKLEHKCLSNTIETQKVQKEESNGRENLYPISHLVSDMNQEVNISVSKVEEGESKLSESYSLTTTPLMVL